MYESSTLGEELPRIMLLRDIVIPPALPLRL